MQRTASVSYTHLGVDQAAGKGIAAAHAIQNIKGVELALKGVAVVPHKGFQAVLAAAMGIADMAGEALEAGVTLNKALEDLVLLFVAGLDVYKRQHSKSA